MVKWATRIKNAAKNGFDAKDRNDASSWPTCAVGEAVSKYNKKNKKMKESEKVFAATLRYNTLSTLGVEFDLAVGEGETAYAEKLRVRIDAFARKHPL